MIALRIVILLMLSVAGARVACSTPESDAPTEKHYTLDELELLAQKHSWSELLLHAEDIYPADRKKKWESIVEMAATQHLREITGAGMSGAAPVAEQLIRTYPFLRGFRTFLEAKRGAALSDFTLCTAISKKGDDCVSQLWSFVQGSKDDTELAFRAGKKVAQNQDPVAALPFFHWAIKRSVAQQKAAFCADSDTRQAVLAGLRLAEGERSQQALSLADEECWAALHVEIEDAFDRESAGNVLKNTCPLLRARKLLGKKRIHKCLTTDK